MVNLRAVDLNLLVVLDALLDEAHVTRAADRLGLSQPATSSALDRCRHLFADPLLERGRGVMRRTARAEALRAPLKTLLGQMAAVLDPPVLDLAQLRQSIRITMADHPAVAVLGDLLPRLAATAPGLDLVIQPWHGAAAALEALAKGQSDLALSVFPAVEAAFRREEVLREHYLVVMRKDHPAAACFDLDQWLAWPHVLVSGRGETRGALDEALLRHGRTRRVGLVVPSFLMVPPLLVGSGLIAMLPSRCLPAGAEESLAVFPPPIAVEGFPLHLAWHARRDEDRALRHVGALIRQILAG
ncbi:DNA-binding transcriptional LysR family regulator [Humitalea rosea]|uniref:DNA-binding transcriptional LysR family regulator n=1 Tax=Humitalea rosea TaxID=990373 RepID=A0A2W7IWN5_9PROT|nr:LysR substrate-binding domain-containing protein [Humitalea rosea]PZW50330.1 DNA-binding transcriptional LysR family regulator [Humitalea rosea]